MNTIFCNRCGQANLPNSINCIKCNNFINQVNRVENLNVKTKNNNKLCWMIGAASIVIFLGAFFVSVVGVGAYFYFSPKRYQVRSQPTLPPPAPTSRETQNDPKPKVVVVEKKDETLAKMTNEDVQSYINEDLKQVGKYKLVKTGTPKPFFTGSKTEQFGMYDPEDNNKEAVVFIMATYLSIADSKNFIEKKMAEINQNDGKITYRNSTPEADSLVFQMKGEAGQIIRCNKGICINVQATTSKDAADFYEAYQNRPAK